MPLPKFFNVILQFRLGICIQKHEYRFPIATILNVYVTLNNQKITMSLHQGQRAVYPNMLGFLCERQNCSEDLK